MAQYLPLVMQQLFNRPLAVSEAHGAMIASALSGRLDIRSIETETKRMDARAMRDLAAMGRRDADARREAAVGPVGDLDRNQYHSSGKSFMQVGSVAIIPIQGTLVRTWGVGPYSGSTGYDGIQAMLLDAMTDRDIAGIWLDINSHGGTVDGLFGLQALIRACSERGGGKPIWAMCADYAFSAAYALACAADKVIVPPTGEVGSIGVITMHADVTKRLDNEGIAVTIIRSGAHKAPGFGGLEALPDDERARQQAMIDQLREVFAESVAANRSISKSAVFNTEGLTYMGAAAKQIGLVTDVLSEVEAWAKFQRKLAR